MNARERGFLLLTSRLGNPERKVLTDAQLRDLTQRMRSAQPQGEERELTLRDLEAIGCGTAIAQRILALLEERELLECYVNQGARAGCIPVTRVSPAYPGALRRRLGGEAPGCLWAKGDLEILDQPAVALVGSRELREENRVFAEAVGIQAAKQGWALVSGNARGADRTAQSACLRQGGRVISVVADSLEVHGIRNNMLFLSEEAFDAEFTAQRALHRNRVIHSLGRMTFVAQSDFRKGGTWSGTAQNLTHGWSNVFCFDDGSEAARTLSQMGATRIGMGDLKDFSALQNEQRSFFNIL